MITLAIAIITRNEAARLPACLESVMDCGDIFVIDSNSDDGTPEIAAAAGATIINFTWNGEYPKKRQWFLNQLPAHYDWVLFIDADERLTPELRTEILEFRAAPPAHYNAYWVKADPIFTGRRLRHGQSNAKICLLRRSQAIFPVVDDLDSFPFEMEGHYQPLVTGKVGMLQQRLLHICDPVDDWIMRHVKYAAANARGAALSHGAAATGWRGFAKRWLARHTHAGLIMFLYGYIFKRGFLDGRAGFDYVVARAWYYWLSGMLRSQNANGDTARGDGI